MPLIRPQTKKRTRLLRQLKTVFRGLRSQPVSRVIETDQSDPARLGPLLLTRARQSLFRFHSQLGRAQGAASPGQSPYASRLRLETVESAVVI